MGSCCCCKGSQSELASPNPYGPPLGAVTDSNKVSPGSSATPPRPPGAEAAGEEKDKEGKEKGKGKGGERGEGPPGAQTAGGDAVVAIMHTAGDEVAVLRVPYQLPSDAAKTWHEEDDLFSWSVVCSSTTVDGEEPNLAESTWPDVSLPTASMRIDPSTHMHACTISEFDSDDDFSPADHSFSFTDSRRVSFLARERDRAALREIAASEATERRIIVDFFEVVRWSIAIKRCKGLLAIERRVLLIDFFRERAALLLSAVEAQEFVGRRALELQWHTLLPYRSKRRSLTVGTAEIMEPVEVIGTAEIMEPVEVIGTADVMEPVDVIGTADVMEPVDVIGTADVMEPVDVIGTAVVMEPVDVIGTAVVMEPVDVIGTADVMEPVEVIGTADVMEPVEVIGTADVMEPVDVIGTAESVEPLSVTGTVEVTEPLGVTGTVAAVEPLGAVRGIGSAEAVGSVRAGRAKQRPATAPVSHFRALREPAAAADCVAAAARLIELVVDTPFAPLAAPNVAVHHGHRGHGGSPARGIC